MVKKDPPRSPRTTIRKIMTKVIFPIWPSNFWVYSISYSFSIFAFLPIVDGRYLCEEDAPEPLINYIDNKGLSD